MDIGAINTQGTHILRQINVSVRHMEEGTHQPPQVRVYIYGLTIEFTTILKNRYFDDKSIQRIVQAALSAADSEAELIDRGL